jgi:hypothetical protein
MILHMGREHVATRLDEPEYEQIQKITEEKGISRSEAMRRVVQDGLEARGRIDTPDTNVNAGQSEDDTDTRTVKSGQIIQGTARQQQILSIVQTMLLIIISIFVAGGAL